MSPPPRALRRLLRPTLQLSPPFAAPAAPWLGSRVHGRAGLGPQGTLNSAGRLSRGAPQPPVPRARRRWSPKDPPVARAAGGDTVAGPLGRPQGGYLGSAVGRGAGSCGVEDGLEAGESGSRGEAALRVGHPWGVSLAGKPFLLFLERRRFPGECKCFPGRLLRLLPCHSSPPLCPTAVPGAPRPSQGRAHPGPGCWCSAAPTDCRRALGASGLGLAGPPGSRPPTPHVRICGVGSGTSLSRAPLGGCRTS